MEPLLVTIAATWIGAVGVGLIRVGLKLNNAVQRLTVVVDGLNAEVNRQRRQLRATTIEHAERLSALERKHHQEKRCDTP